MNYINYFIVNLGSKTGKSYEIYKGVEAFLKQNKVEFEVRFTKGAKDASEFAKEASAMASEDTIVKLFVMGGDGTINETINGITDFEHVYLCVLPMGSGNDFVRGLNLLGDTVSILKAALSKTDYSPLDLGLVEYEGGSRLFGVSCGIGVDAQVCMEANESKLKKILNVFHMGSATYGLMTVGDIFTMEFSDAYIEADGKTFDFKGCIFAAAMNSAYEGGGIAMVPYAKQNSGFLSAFVAHDIKRIKCFGMLPFLVAGKHERFKGFDFIDFNKMTVKLSKPSCVHCDGEHLGFFEQVTYTCLPGKLKYLGDV